MLNYLTEDPMVSLAKRALGGKIVGVIDEHTIKLNTGVVLRLLEDGIESKPHGKGMMYKLFGENIKNLILTKVAMNSFNGKYMVYFSTTNPKYAVVEDGRLVMGSFNTVVLLVE